MKNYAWLALALAISASAVVAQDWNAGVAAFERGDYKYAYNEFRPLAEQGDPYAQSMLGAMFSEGKGVAHDHAEAAHWFSLAGKQGVPQALFNLAVMHANGTGVPQDHLKALRLYRLAAERGSTDAHNNIGAMYANGAGVKTNRVLSYMWLELSCARGDKIGCGYREKIATEMTPQEIARSKRLATICAESRYHDCDE